MLFVKGQLLVLLNNMSILNFMSAISTSISNQKFRKNMDTSTVVVNITYLDSEKPIKHVTEMKSFMFITL